jgi:hypothetical protein
LIIEGSTKKYIKASIAKKAEMPEKIIDFLKFIFMKPDYLLLRNL